MAIKPDNRTIFYTVQVYHFATVYHGKKKPNRVS